MPSNFVKFLQRIRVFSGFVFAIVFLVFSRPTPLTLAGGISIALTGVMLRAWACGHLRKSSELDVSGPYAHTRNPLYLGTFMIALGFGLASGSWWLFLLVAAYIGSIYFPVMNVEADVLEQRLGEKYREYALHVPLLIPRLSPWKKSERRFDFQLYLKNAEYNAAMGFAVASLFLALKSYLYGS
ncbi:MAG: isoprenylcysteine carboxylmethyltransferase family protein [bacterium]|nr:isoprenylcysteine carboxylmethyltransferase family protein [bacterium]